MQKKKRLGKYQNRYNSQALLTVSVSQKDRASVV
jgi:hypothetical protein